MTLAMAFDKTRPMEEFMRITSGHDKELKCPNCGKSNWKHGITNYGEIAYLECEGCGYEVEFGMED